RNIVQCLNDFDIPLYLNHTITKIEGKERVTGVVVSEVDENKRPIAGTEMHFDCDTVLFSVGLIPENELTKEAGIALSPRTRGAVVYQNRETEVSGVFACGNVLQVHDLVDFVSEESELAGRSAAKYVSEGETAHRAVETVAGQNVSYVLPQKIDRNIGGDVKLFLRVTNTFQNCTIRAMCGDQVLAERKKRIAVPGEMETLILREAAIKGASGEITVCLEVNA
ncbi:MAG: FAD-dependent oxidoreductase, partial [Clostridiales bacterium]|nr:FAD-dependent oxidoreductase [Clostridiales bacterium]